MRRSQDKMGKAERNTFILKCAINQSINAIKIFMHTRPNYRHVPVCIRFSSEYTTHSAHRMQRSTKIIRTIRRRSAHAAASWWTMGKERGTRWPAQRQQDRFGESCQNCMRCELNEEKQMVPKARMWPSWCMMSERGGGMWSANKM